MCYGDTSAALFYLGEKKNQKSFTSSCSRIDIIETEM